MTIAFGAFGPNCAHYQQRSKKLQHCPVLLFDATPPRVFWLVSPFKPLSSFNITLSSWNFDITLSTQSTKGSSSIMLTGSLATSQINHNTGEGERIYNRFALSAKISR